MFGVVTVVVGMVLLVLLMGVALLVGWTARTARRGRADDVAAEWRTVRLTRLVGVLAGALGAWIVLEKGSHGTGAMLAPAVFGLSVLVAVALGETVVRPARADGVRSASLETRRVRDYLPPVASRVVAAMAVLMAGTLLLTTLTASQDEYTGAMRALECSSTDVGVTRTPYAGSYYSAPLALVLLVVLIVAGLAARQVVRRPRGMSTTDEGDDVLRCRSLDVVVASAGIAVSAPFLGIAVTTAIALRGLASAEPSCAPPWAGAVSWALLLAAPVALGVLGWCLLALTVSLPRQVADAPTSRQTEGEAQR